jgi:hypothetical protein
MTARRIVVRLTEAQARRLLAAIVYYGTELEDDTLREQLGVTGTQVATLDRACKALVDSAHAAGVRLT